MKIEVLMIFILDDTLANEVVVDWKLEECCTLKYMTSISRSHPAKDIKAKKSESTGNIF